MRRFVLDSNAVDPIADLPGAYETVHAAVADGRIEVLFTHVTVDELAAIPDLEKRTRLLRTLSGIGRQVPTGAFVLDVSPLGFARLNDDPDLVETLRSSSIRHTNDALIAATSDMEQCALVTNERRLAGRARDQGIEVLTSAEFLTELEASGEL